MEEKLKFKPLTKSQILISLDRLTRFKPAEEKYSRVFKDIIVSNLIEPKYSRKQLDLMSYDKLKNIAEYIFNSSLPKTEKNPLVINKKIFKYETKIFSLNEGALNLLENKIDYNCAVKFIEEKNAAYNLRWLKSLCGKTPQRQYRTRHSIKFPIERVIIVEGITEEILLPEFSKLCGYDFNKNGVHLISAGGKNQAVKIFYKLTENIKLPVFVLLDRDAQENFQDISLKMRKTDKVYVIKKGEFEDLLPLPLIKKTLNEYFNFSSVSLKELQHKKPMSKILEEIFKQKGFGEFKKAGFAQMVKKNISSKIGLNDEIKNIITLLAET